MISEDHEIPEWVHRTQETLGRLISKPRLTLKLLVRPPFRFLLDIFAEVMDRFSYLEDVVTREELSANMILV